LNLKWTVFGLKMAKEIFVNEEGVEVSVDEIEYPFHNITK
jgi:hypothetical protein